MELKTTECANLKGVIISFLTSTIIFFKSKKKYAISFKKNPPFINFDNSTKLGHIHAYKKRIYMFTRHNLEINFNFYILQLQYF